MSSDIPWMPNIVVSEDFPPNAIGFAGPNSVATLWLDGPSAAPSEGFCPLTFPPHESRRLGERAGRHGWCEACQGWYAPTAGGYMFERRPVAQ